MNEKDFAELAAGHALHALSDADEQRYADALAEHPGWRRGAAIDERTAAMLADSVAPVTPPADIREALLAQIAVTPQNPDSSDTPATAVAPPRRWGRMFFALAASVALVVGVGFGIAALTAQLTKPASVVALEQIESSTDAQQASIELASGASATAHWSASIGEAVLVTEGLEALDENSTYQLWLVRGETPVPAGLFQTDAGSATALLDGTMHDGDVIAVTVEPAGGSPTGVPTTEPILAIPTA